jgi:hypothetical protein
MRKTSTCTAPLSKLTQCGLIGKDMSTEGGGAAWAWLELVAPLPAALATGLVLQLRGSGLAVLPESLPAGVAAA